MSVSSVSALQIKSVEDPRPCVLSKVGEAKYHMTFAEYVRDIHCSNRFLYEARKDLPKRIIRVLGPTINDLMEFFKMMCLQKTDVAALREFLGYFVIDSNKTLADDMSQLLTVFREVGKIEGALSMFLLGVADALDVEKVYARHCGKSQIATYEEMRFHSLGEFRISMVLNKFIPRKQFNLNFVREGSSFRLHCIDEDSFEYYVNASLIKELLRGVLTASSLLKLCEQEK